MPQFKVVLQCRKWCSLVTLSCPHSRRVEQIWRPLFGKFSWGACFHDNQPLKSRNLYCTFDSPNKLSGPEHILMSSVIQISPDFIVNFHLLFDLHLNFFGNLVPPKVVSCWSRQVKPSISQLFKAPLKIKYQPCWFQIWFIYHDFEGELSIY